MRSSLKPSAPRIGRAPSARRLATSPWAESSMSTPLCPVCPVGFTFWPGPASSPHLARSPAISQRPATPATKQFLTAASACLADAGVPRRTLCAGSVRAWRRPVVAHLGGSPAGAGGTYLVDRDANQHPLLLLHGAAVLVPVGMLPADAAVVVDQPVHRRRQRHDLRRPLDLHPTAEEAVREHAQDRGRVTPQVAGLVGGLPGGDDELPLAVDSDQDGRGLQTTTGPAGGEHGPVVAGDEFSCVVGVHTPSLSPKSARSGRVHGCTPPLISGIARCLTRRSTTTCRRPPCGGLTRSSPPQPATHRHGRHPQLADAALAPRRPGCILGWPAACSMVWPTSPGATACSRCVS